MGFFTRMSVSDVCSLFFIAAIAVIVMTAIIFIYNNRSIKSKISGFMPKAFYSRTQLMALYSIQLMVERLINDINLGWYDRRSLEYKAELSTIIRAIKERAAKYNLRDNVVRVAKKEIYRQSNLRRMLLDAIFSSA